MRQKAQDDLAAATLSASVATGGLLLDCLAHAAERSAAGRETPSKLQGGSDSLWHIAAQLVRSRPALPIRIWCGGRLPACVAAA